MSARNSLDVRRVLRRTGKGLVEHNAMGQAAELAYFTFLSIFPFLICVVAAISALEAGSVIDEVRKLAASVAPKALVDAMIGQMVQLSRAGNILIIALGLTGALWSGSSALHSLMAAVNRAYDTKDDRRWSEIRVTALWLSAGVATLVTGVIILATLLPWLAARATDSRTILWVLFGGITRWVFVWLAIAGAAALVYMVSLDPRDRHRKPLWPGAALAATLWTIATAWLHIYVTQVGRYGVTYGALGGAMFVLLWFYFTNLSVLVGAEVNGQLAAGRK